MCPPLGIKMRWLAHHDASGYTDGMRTTLTLDDDVAAKLRAEARRSGTSFKETVNNALRRGLNPRSSPAVKRAFVVRARDLGALRTGLTLDNVGDLLETVEGARHR
jgi:plasmid stability protein